MTLAIRRSRRILARRVDNIRSEETRDCLESGYAGVERVRRVE